jgi:hypothetical protein
MATTGPVSQLPSKSAAAPSFLPQSDAVPVSASNASSLLGSLPHRPSSPSSASEDQSRAASPTVCMLPLLVGFVAHLDFKSATSTQSPQFIKFSGEAEVFYGICFNVRIYGTLCLRFVLFLS